VTLEIFDVQGKRVTTLLNAARHDAGFHTVLWDGTTAGHRAASGIYFVRLTTDARSWTRRVVVTR
jgi:hypothetical protein